MGVSIGLHMVDLGPLFKVTGAVDLFSVLGRFPHDILRMNEAGLLKFGLQVHHLRGPHGIADC